jgi:hypothetical protein
MTTSNGVPANPFQAILNLAEKTHAEELQRAAAMAGRRREDRHEWGPRMQSREAELQALVDAALLAAGATGFPVEEVERRVNNLAAAVRAILLWQRDAPFPPREEREGMEWSGTWHDPASDYLRDQYARMMDAWQPVHVLAVRADGSGGPARQAQREAKDTSSPAPAAPAGKAARPPILLDLFEAWSMDEAMCSPINLQALYRAWGPLHPGLDDHPAPPIILHFVRERWGKEPDREMYRRLRDMVCSARKLGPKEAEQLPLDEVVVFLPQGPSAGAEDTQQAAPTLTSAEPGPECEEGHRLAPEDGPNPSAAPGGGLLHFDLPTIFRCAVELGAAVQDQADGAESREAWTAGDRLLRVLNPRDATFPTNFAWDEFQAIRECGIRWPGEEEPRPGWKQELDLTDAPPAARQALLTIGLALADLRGDLQWHQRGRELLSAGAWNLWEGMGPENRAEARHLLPEAHRIWGWPADAAGEPGPFAGPRATLEEARILNPYWRTGTSADLDPIHRKMRESNYRIDDIEYANRKRFAVYRLDCRPSNAALPTVCPKAMPKPPVELRSDGYLPAEIEARYRSLGLIGEGPGLHWVGRERSHETTCTCDLTAPCAVARPAEWDNLRQLRQAIVALIGFVQARYERCLRPQELHQLDHLSERVNGLTRAVGMELPDFPVPQGEEALLSYGPASVPVRVTDGGYIPSPRAGRLWELEWRAVRLAVEARLVALDPNPLPCQAPTTLQVDIREVPMMAPTGTPSPLREAYEAVAEVLSQAAEMRRSPPRGWPMFEELARELSAALATARERYNLAEVSLRAATDDDGRCAHQEALSAASRINDACGHVMLSRIGGNSLSPYQAVAHVQAAPAFNLDDLLRAMRRQTSKAAVHLQALTYLTGPGSPPHVTGPQVKADQTTETEAGANATTGQNRKGKCINEQMLKKLEEDPGRIGWGVRDWAEHLGCSVSTVQGTKAWENILTSRALREAEKVTRRKRTSKRPAD